MASTKPALGPSTLDVMRWITFYASKNHGATPTYAEIMAGMGFNSKSVVAYHVARLIQAGWLARHGRYTLVILASRPA